MESSIIRIWKDWGCQWFWFCNQRIEAIERERKQERGKKRERERNREEKGWGKEREMPALCLPKR